MSLLHFVIVTLLGSSSVYAQESRFFGRCNVHGAYGKGCIEFYDGTWTDSQMKQICHSVAARGSLIEIDTDRKCVRDQFQSLCISQQLFSLAYIYLDHIDRLSCQAILNGKIYKRPEGGW